MKLTKQQMAEYVEKYAPLAEKVAGHTWRHTPGLNGLDEDDYRQYAMMGLMDALRRFKPSTGSKFQSYAYRRIAGYIRDEIRKVDEVARSARRDGIKGATVRLDKNVCGDDGDGVIAMRYLIPACENKQDDLEAYDEVDRLLGGLTRECRSIVFMRHVEGLSLWKIAKVLGVTQAYISELLDTAMEYLQKCHVQGAITDSGNSNQLKLF